MIVYFGRRRFRSGWFYQVSHSIYIRTVRPLLHFSFGTFDSSWMVWAETRVRSILLRPNGPYTVQSSFSKQQTGAKSILA